MSTFSQVNADLTNQLKVVLTSFAVPNNTTLLQATKDLHELSQHSSFLSSLFFIFANEENPQLRQTAAIVFRRKAMRLWKSLDTAAQLEIRQTLLHSLIAEKERVVKHSIMEIIGGISKLELSASKNWPDLMNFIKQSIQASDLKEKECGAELLKIVCESSAEHFEGQYDALLMLIDEALQSNLSSNSSSYFVEAFNYLVPYLGDDQTRLVQPLVPKCVQIIKALLESNCEAQASDLVEVFESLIETEVSFIASYVKDLVLFLLQIAGDSNMDDDIRSRVLSVLQCIIRLKKKALLKNKLLGPIIDIVCPILVAPIDENENDEAGFIGESSDGQTPLASALHVMDDMALHFPPEQLFQKLIPFIEGCVSSNEDRCKRALFLALACLSEGTSEYIKAKHMRDFLEVVCRGVVNPHPRVRSAALFALGQFSEHLQPDISQFASEIMPLLFDALQTMQGDGKGSGLTKAYYALENFVENLESEILPYLDKLMNHLLSTLRSECSIHTKELVVSAIGAVANAAKNHLLPFLSEILVQIQACLSSLTAKDTTEELTILHSQALDTLSVLVRNLGGLNLQLAEDSMKLGMQLMEMEDTDPDLRSSAYGLFAAVASVVGEKMQPFFPPIVRCLVNTLQSTEGIIANYSSHENGGHDFSFLDDSATDLESADDETETVEGFSVENAYMDEKVDALDAIGSFAKHCGRSFEPHLDLFITETIRLQDFPHSDIRKASLIAYGQLFILAHKLDHKLADDIRTTVFPGLSLIIQNDSERLVVMTAIATAKEVVESCGLQALTNQEKDVESLMTSVLRVLQQKSACQDDEVEEEDDQQAEYDEMLIEYCGEILPVLADKLKAAFLPYFLACLPIFCNKLKPGGTTSEKSFAAGTIAETVEKLGPCCPEEVLKNVIPRFIQLSRDTEIEVRNNVLYGLGILLQNGGEAAAAHFPPVLGCLSQALIREPSRRVVDNILSAVARMITTNKNILPLAQIIPVFLDHLPIEEDHDEDVAVYGCLASLLQDPDFNSDLKWVAKVTDVFAQVLSSDGASKDVKTSLENEIKNLKSRGQTSISEIIQSKTLSPRSRDVVERLWST